MVSPIAPAAGPLLSPLPAAPGPAAADTAAEKRPVGSPRQATAGLGARSVRLDLAALTAVQAKGGSDSTSHTPSPEEQKAVAELKARDREVRRHENAHARAGGEFAGVPSYQYTRGPDGKA